MSDPLASPPTTLRPHTRVLKLWSLATALAALHACAAVALQLRALRAPSLALVDPRALAFADRSALAAGIGVTLAALAGLALYARWTHRAYTFARALGVAALPMSASRAAWSFVLPVVQVLLPLRALAGLARALDSALAAEPLPRAAPDAAGHYRDNASLRATDRPMPAVPLAAAWLLWWTAQALSFAVSYTRPQLVTLHALRRSLWLDGASQLALVAAALLLARVAVALDARIAALAARPAVEA